MKPPTNMTRIVDRKRYSVETAMLIADDRFWDGQNWENGGQNKFLYKTRNGAYFLVTLTKWRGEQDTLVPVGEDEAIWLYENNLPEHYVDYNEAFPGVTVRDA
jgi:hypothetical protein